MFWIIYLSLQLRVNRKGSLLSNSPRTSILKGVALTVAMRWTDRLIGLISTIVLARLLLPEDFGIIAMASLAIGLVDVFLNLGVHVAIIQNREATQAHYDTAWTLRLIQTAVATLALVFCSPLAADYFRDPRVEPVLQILSFMLLLAGLENIGLVAFQKNMQFGAETRFLLIRRLSGFFITLAGAALLRSYWALVIGTLASRAIGAALSYRMHPMRPKLSLAKFREIFGVSQWMLVRSVGMYLHDNLHRILVGRWFAAPVLGAYTLGWEISSMPSGELLAPLNRVLFPAFAEAKGEPERLKKMFLLAQGVQSLVAIPAAVGLALVAEEAVYLLLGEQWMAVVPFVQVLALGNIVYAMTSSGNYVLIVLGKIKLIALTTWIQVIMFAGVALTMLSGGEAIAVAWLRLGIVGAGLWLSFALLIRAFPVVGWGELFRSSLRPLLGVAAMGVLLTLVGPYLDLPIAWACVAKVLLGAVAYVGTVMLLWNSAGRPGGPETYLLDKCLSRWRQKAKVNAVGDLDEAKLSPGVPAQGKKPVN